MTDGNSPIQPANAADNLGLGWGVAILIGMVGWWIFSDLDVSGLMDDLIDECALAEDTAAQLVEQQQQNMLAFLFSALGAAGAERAQNITSTPTMSQTALIRENPDGSLVCSSVASTYNATKNEVTTEEVRYVVSDRADGGLGFHVQLLMKHQWK